MISKAKQKFIKSLERKKGRKEAGAFLAEGPKVVGDLLQVMPARMIVATEEWLRHHSYNISETIIVTEDELRQVSFLQHPQEVLAVFPIPLEESLIPHPSSSQLFLALDGIQDPGNLGTIIRIADWFGIEHIVCSADTVDVYNPKVVQATMGTLAHVHVCYKDLVEWLGTLPMDFPIYGTSLDGEDLYGQTLTPHGVIIMGNEGNGVSQAVGAKVNRRLLIPPYPIDSHATDSLNVAIATAIVCGEFRRRVRG